MSKGVLYSLTSRTIFILGSYAIHIYLARLLGPEKYGVFGTCLALITISYVFLSSGVRQVVSVSAAKNPESAKYFLDRGLGIQLAISSILGLLVVIFSKNLAHLFHDTSLEKPLYISAAIIVTQSLFFVNMGVLNGLRKFGAENVLMSTYGVVRTFAAIILVYAGMAVIGGLLGFLIASISVFLLGSIFTHNLPNTKYSGVSISSMLKSSIPVIIMFSAKSIVMNIDLLAVKYFIRDGQFTGYYTSAAAISKLSYWFLVAFGVVILPFVSSSFNKNDIELTRKYIKEVIRYSLLLILPATFVFCIYANDLVTFIYGRGYHPASIILTTLIWGLLGLGLMYIFFSIMIGIGQEMIMVRYSLIGIALSLILNIILVQKVGVIGAALSTTIASGTMVVLSYRFIVKKLTMMVELKSIIKVISSLLILGIIAYSTNGIAVSFILKGIVLYAVFFLALTILKEINSADVDVAKKLIYSRAK